MRSARARRLLVRCYPPAWRARYGEEMDELMIEVARAGGATWKTGLDVLVAGVRERLDAAGLGGRTPHDRARGGALTVLWAWVAFALAGVGVQKASEHWRAVTPVGDRALPSGAFAALVAVAVLASVAVVVGLALALPALVRFLRAGGWPHVRRRVFGAAVLTVLALVGVVVIVVWGHDLTPAQRDGRDAWYGAAVVGVAGMIAACAVGWVLVASAVARGLELTSTTLRAEARLAVGVTAAMGVMTVAVVVWWSAVGHAAPWFFAGRPAGAPASGFSIQMLVAVALMLGATALGVYGSRRAVRAVPELSGSGSD